LPINFAKYNETETATGASASSELWSSYIGEYIPEIQIGQHKRYTSSFNRCRIKKANNFFYNRKELGNKNESKFILMNLFIFCVGRKQKTEYEGF